MIGLASPRPGTDPQTARQPSLCEVLLWIAGDTFHWLHNGHHHYPPAPGEESFTDGNIRHLRQFAADRVKVFQFTKGQERQNGADWEMWIHNRTHGVGLRIQAKKASKPQRYPFDHTVAGEFQCDLLVQNASAVGCVPVYLLYNHWDWVGGSEEEAAQAGLLCDHVAADGSHHGCTLLSAYRVQSEVGRKASGRNVRHTALWKGSLPWNRVLCDRRRSANASPSRSSSEILGDVFTAVKQLTLVGLGLSPTYSAGAPHNGTQEDAAYGQISNGDGDDDAPEILRGGPHRLPPHVRRLLQAHEAEPPAPPVPTVATVLVDVSDDRAQTPPNWFEGCILYR
ncbi:hypothetical protein JK359_35675 [Streptomyces actinomycinicus]|uniref:Uncharacterized protein n=1 Tax=Streptomyces actinomycinicus TaxID=1695166 RepID=A0A937EPP4_9ACTN|nr:DUF6615 family protein [Streptomyces actinomycinicus]MBL1087247.1 hypothetical protein [Streptomyces actinomycinicus]